MAGNRGATSLKGKARSKSPMNDFDRLPKELRAWIAAADLPWRPNSVRRTFERTMSRTGDRQRALDELDRLQRRLVTKDTQKVWGRDHPQANEQFET